VTKIGYKLRPESFVVELVCGRCGWIRGLIAINLRADMIDVLNDPIVHLGAAHKCECEGDVSEWRDDCSVVKVDDAIETKFSYELIGFGSITIKRCRHGSLERAVLYAWEIRGHCGSRYRCCASWGSSCGWPPTSSWWSGGWASTCGLSWGRASSWRS
jgi:hypothetical protein